MRIMRPWIFSPALFGAVFICATTIVSAAEEANLLVAIHGVAEVYPAEGRSAAGYVVFADDPLILRGSFVNDSPAMIQGWGRLVRSPDGQNLRARRDTVRRGSSPSRVRGRTRVTGLQVAPAFLDLGDVEAKEGNVAAAQRRYEAARIAILSGGDQDI